MTAETITFQRRTTLEDIVRDLLDTYRNADDDPPEHVCTPACTHAEEGRRPLMVRLAELAEPSRQLLKAKDSPTRSKQKPGSPAPWSAAPAELLDEILNGALDFNRRGRRVLGWPDLEISVPAFVLVPGHEGDPAPYGIGPRPWVPDVTVPPRRVLATSTSIETAGRVALRGLPGVVRALMDNAPERRLGSMEFADGRLGQGYIETAVRSWHRRALELTGHEVRWERLPAVRNPDHWTNQPPPLIDEHTRRGPRCKGGECEHESCAALHLFRRTIKTRWLRRHRFEGPVCADVRCEHGSCFRLRQRRVAWLPWYCPRCHCDSLRHDPVSDLVHCMRPSCTDDEGHPSVWSRVAFEAGATDPWSQQ